jgi:5-methylthioadenosine/S-adenosylhomocysteine deaminase
VRARRERIAATTTAAVIRYHARWVLPVGAAPIRDGTVVVDGERIAWVGPRATAPAGADEDLGDAILMPGLVNTHIHLDLAAFAGVLGGLGFFAWVRTLVRGLGDAASPEMLVDASRWSVADQLAHGVTAIGHTGPGRAAFDALREMGARGVAYLEVFGPDPAQCEASFAALRALVDHVRRGESALVRAGVSPHAPYSVSDALYSRVAAWAREDALPVAVHIAESDDESRYVAGADGEFASMLRARGIAVAPRAGSPVALLERTGVLATKPLCIHAIRVEAADIGRMAAAGATVAHCPRANAWLQHGRAPVHALRAAGVPVGLGTDSIASNDAVRLLAEARDAADDTLAPAARVEMATRGGARALGIESVTGTLAAGKSADLTAFVIGDVRACDAFPERYLIEHCAMSPAALTVVAGAVRARDGRAMGGDAGLTARMDAHRARIRAWASNSLEPAPKFRS